jgi:geranylgeranyl diphosphate synthase type II
MNGLKRNAAPESGCPKEIVLRDINAMIEKATGYIPGSPRFPTSIICQASLKHLRAGGGRTRSLLCFQVGEALGLDYLPSIALGATAELLHNASLVHDDIHDKSLTRRGKPNVRAVYGDDIAILTGDLMISGAYGLLAEHARPDTLAPVIAHVHRIVREVIDGQGSDLESHKRFHSVDDYLAIASAKSGGLIRLAMQLPFIATQHDSTVIDAAGHAADSYALSYQIFDDLLDIAEDSGHAGKIQSLNIYHLLTARMSSAEAMREARQTALRLLEQVDMACDVLPQGAGQPLILLAQQLETLIIREFPQ